MLNCARQFGDGPIVEDYNIDVIVKRHGNVQCVKPPSCLRLPELPLTLPLGLALPKNVDIFTGQGDSDPKKR